MMDNIEEVTTDKGRIYKIKCVSKKTYLVAHNGKDVAHVIDILPGQECVTGLTLEKYDNRGKAEEKASIFGWKFKKFPISNAS